MRCLIEFSAFVGGLFFRRLIDTENLTDSSVAVLSCAPFLQLRQDGRDPRALGLFVLFALLFFIVMLGLRPSRLSLIMGAQLAGATELLLIFL